MRLLLIAAVSALLTAPAAAQPPRPSEQIEAYAPALDRTTDALLDVDLGPLLDALDPYRPHRERTLRDIARRDNPDFDRRLRASIYGNAERMGRAADAMAAAEPALRQAVDRVQRDLDAAINAPPPGPPPGDVNDDWDRDADEGAPPEPDDDDGPPEPNN
ncbi:MAG: hypothetical protein QOH03_5479 [Kribbellaceae bacterium]|jgi:hypothetical protein|nr:hypothetical protein [Kribbellaceae bacterium]